MTRNQIVDLLFQVANNEVLTAISILQIQRGDGIDVELTQSIENPLEFEVVWKSPDSGAIIFGEYDFGKLILRYVDEYENTTEEISRISKALRTLADRVDATNFSKLGDE